MAVNAHRSLYRQGANDTFLSALTVDQEDRDELRAIRDEIRETLRQGFRDWDAVVDRRALFENAALERMTFDAAPPVLRPKFKMQGSWSYDTLNRTTQQPPQEIDLDDGVFLPVSFLSQGGKAHPAVVSRAYFEAVEAILFPLCDERGWSLSPPKPSCVRVEVRAGAHIDLALYAIPDDDFVTLVEKAAAMERFSVRLDEQTAFAEEVYPRLPSDHIMLAHRDEGWKPSDPRKLEDWFRAAIDRHGYQLRRVCRYLKGWRDHQWDYCRLSSITLMACAVGIYDEQTDAFDNARDDHALLAVAERLDGLLAGAIANPVVGGQFLDEGWTTDMRQDFIDKARGLAASLREALGCDDSADARLMLSEELGPYLPDNVDLFPVEDVAAPSILSSGMLKNFEQDERAREAVKLGGDSRYG